MNETLNFLQGMLPADCNTELATILKNNDLTLHGIVIRKTGSALAPNIYIDEYFDRGYTPEETAVVVAQQFEEMEYNAPFQFDESNIFDYEKIKDRICYKVVGKDTNQQYLENDIPYGEIAGNLAVIYYVALNGGVVTVNNRLLKTWGIDEEELYAVADINTARLFPATFESMRETMLHILEECESLEIMKYQYGLENMDDQSFKEFLAKALEAREMPVYVLRAGNAPFGASVMLYDGVLEMVRNTLEKDFIILPSSIHELLIIPYDAELSISDCRKMVQEVNATELSITERLSDSMYFCNGRDIVLLQDEAILAHQETGVER